MHLQDKASGVVDLPPSTLAEDGVEPGLWKSIFNPNTRCVEWAKTAARIALLLICLGAGIRIVSYYFSTNSGGDAGAHAALAADWIQHPTLRFNMDGYPPGHFWLIAVFSLVIHNVVDAARLLSLVLGIASLLFFWKLARLLYGPSAGLLSLLVFVLYTLHIGYSTTSSSEVSFAFFVLAGLYYFFLGVRDESGQLWKLALAGACFSIAEAVRYEAWILFGGLGVILAVLQIKDKWSHGLQWLKPLVSFGVCGGAWPVVMMAYSWRAYGDPMHLVTMNRWRVLTYLAEHATSRAYQLSIMPSALLISLSPLAIAGAVYGLARSFPARFSASFASLTLFFAAVECYEVYTGGLLATARYTITLGTMLALISGYGLESALNKMSSSRAALARAVVVVLLFLNPLIVLAGSEVPNRYSEKLASVSPRLRYQKHIQVVGDYLRKHLHPNDAVVIDDYNVESNVIADAAGIPIPRDDRTYLMSKTNTISVNEYIKVEHPRFLVYANGGALQRVMPLNADSNVIDVNGVKLQCVFRSERYRVYELSYS